MKPSLLNLSLLATAWGVLSLGSTLFAEAAETKLAQCPAPVQKAFREAGTVVKIMKDTESDGVFYQAELTGESGNHIEMEVDAMGKVLKKTEEVKLAACPDVVRKVFLSKSIGKSVAGVEMITDDGGISYLASIKSKDELVTQVEVGADGKVLAIEEELNTKNTPAPISKAIKELAADGKIEEVHKVTDDAGKVTYTAVITTAKKVVMDLEVDAEGKVIEFKKAEEGDK